MQLFLLLQTAEYSSSVKCSFECRFVCKFKRLRSVTAIVWALLPVQWLGVVVPTCVKSSGPVLPVQKYGQHHTSHSATKTKCHGGPEQPFWLALAVALRRASNYGKRRVFAAALITTTVPELHFRSHHKGATGTAYQRFPALCHC